MKKIAIIYGGKTGTTKKCAGILKSLIPEAFVFSVNEDFKLDDYDVLVFGSSIRMGRLDKGIRKLIKRQPYQQKFYVCHALPDYQKIIDDALPSWFKEQAVSLKSFGGEIHIDEAKGFTKLLIKFMLKTVPNQIKQIDEEAIQTFANKIKLLL